MASRGDNLDNKTNRVMLDVELQDLIGAVSKSPGSFLQDSARLAEGEELKKEWFRHVLMTLERFSGDLDKVRREDLGGLKKELKDAIAELKKELNDDLDSLDKRLVELVTDFNKYKTDVVGPLSDKILILTTKLGVWSLIAGILGSGLVMFISWAFKIFLAKTTNLPIQ